MRAVRIVALVVILIVVTIMCIDAPMLLRFVAHLGRFIVKLL